MTNFSAKLGNTLGDYRFVTAGYYFSRHPGVKKIWILE